MTKKQIWTIGHSTRTLEEFLEMLQSFHISVLVDVRHYPGSRKFPHFNKETLAGALSNVNIAYEHIESLGGRRKPQPDSRNTVWRHPAFRGYADYMETSSFRQGFERLVELALQSRTVFMCSEAVWWRCHRSLISDLLKSKGWMVCHIGSVAKSSEHPFTAPARVIDGELTYKAEILDL